MDNETQNMERVRRMAYRAGISEEDVLWVESLSDYYPEVELPDVILENIDAL